MATIYTTQLHNANHVGVFGAVVYTVPANTLTIVTDIDIWFAYTAAGQYAIVLLGAAAPVRVVVTAAGDRTIQWRGRQALTAGQTIQLFLGGSTANVGFTGYVLPPL